MEQNLPEGLTVFSFPSAHRRLIRTTNGVERLNREIKRRTRVVSIFQNEAALFETNLKKPTECPDRIYRIILALSKNR